MQKTYEGGIVRNLEWLFCYTRRKSTCVLNCGIRFHYPPYSNRLRHQGDVYGDSLTNLVYQTRSFLFRVLITI